MWFFFRHPSYYLKSYIFLPNMKKKKKKKKIKSNQTVGTKFDKLSNSMIIKLIDGSRYCIFL